MSVHVLNCKSFLVTEPERKHVRRCAWFQQHRDTSRHQVCFFPFFLTFFSLQGKAPKEIHAILTETLGEHAPSYATIKNLVAQFNHGDFPPVMCLVLDDPKQWPPRRLLMKFTSFLEDRRILAKSIAEQLGISRERVGSIIGHAEALPWKGSLNASTRIKNVSSASRLSNSWNFFGAIQMISCRDWWPWTKPGYITMTKQQSMEWRHSGSPCPAPKNSECKNPLEKFSPRFFWDQGSIILIIFQRAKLSAWSITYLCWCNWRTFWRKNATCGKVIKGVLFLRDNAPAHRALATQKKLAYLGFPCLGHPPYSPDLALD